MTHTHTGHPAWPSGHATESFAGATLLNWLVRDPNGKNAPKFDPDALIAAQVPLYRQSERIAINRTVAGVHYPTDSMAGAVLGVTMVEALVNLMEGKKETTARTYFGNRYKGDFNLSLLSAEMQPGGTIKQKPLAINPKGVPDWLQDMWDTAKHEG